MNVDVITMSFSKTKELYEMSKRMLDSLVNNNPEHEFNVNIVQTIDNKYGDEHYFGNESFKIFHPNVKFHYNDFIKYAYEKMSNTSDYILICNDDVTFQKGSITELLEGIKVFDIASSMNPESKYNTGRQSKHIGTGRFIQGYETSEHFSGWCHLIDKNLFNTIPYYIFWESAFGGFFQDNWICHLGKVHRLAMGVCTEAIVNHIECASDADNTDREYFSMEQRAIFDEKVKNYKK